MRCPDLRSGLIGLAAALVCSGAFADPRCVPGDGGLVLPGGFCAAVVASDVGPVRNLAVAPNGDVFAGVRTRGGTGGVLALRDADGDGRAEVREHFGAGDGHGILLTPSHLYLATRTSVLRWPRQEGSLRPSGRPEVIVRGFPDQRSHAAKAIALDGSGALFVTVGGPSNACQEQRRTPGSPGRDPCPQLRLQAGVWRYRADLANQTHRADARIATGMRQTLALAIDPASGALWAAINGRDQLGALWGYDADRNAELPAEELVRVEEGTDVGWPYCYHDGLAGEKVLAPEYGGDGRAVGRCAEATRPAVAFPAHWAPMDLAFYDAQSFPERYHGGLFVAFRGSWNRAPRPQEGFRVSFVPFSEGAPSAAPETFAIGTDPTALRMTGVAVGPDGSLYIAADANGTIWRVLRKAS